MAKESLFSSLLFICASCKLLSNAIVSALITYCNEVGPNFNEESLKNKHLNGLKETSLKKWDF